MADQDRLEGAKTQVAKHGQFDINPISNLPHWLVAWGFRSIKGRNQRIEGKRLSFSLYPRPILAIHFNQSTGFWIQTDQTLLFFTPATILLADEVISDTDSSLVIDDTNDQHIIAR